MEASRQQRYLDPGSDPDGDRPTDRVARTYIARAVEGVWKRVYLRTDRYPCLAMWEKLTGRCRLELSCSRQTGEVVAAGITMTRLSFGSMTRPSYQRARQHPHLGALELH